MSAGGTTLESGRQALVDIQRYLADEIAPLMAIDAARTLAGMEPKYGAAAIQQWLENQLAVPDRAVSVSSYLYHAIKKIHLFSELKLVDPAAIDPYVAQLSLLVVRMCPEGEQAGLRMKLSRLGESETKLSAPVKLLNRERGSEEEEEQIDRVLEQQKQAQEEQPESPTRETAPKVLISPRVAMLTERLEKMQESQPQQSDGSGKDAQPAGDVVASLVSRAAIDSEDASQFESSLARVREMGIDPRLDQVFRELGKRLPGWEVNIQQEEGAKPVSYGHLLKAMQQIVSLSGSVEEGAERFGGMVYAAIEQFNDGHLAQAVAMFDVAQGLIDDDKVDAGMAKIVRSRAEGSISARALRKFSTTPQKHGLLRKVLTFFDALSPQKLLERLDGEKKRNVRKLILSLIEVHGPPCRPILVERLGRYLAEQLPDPGGHYSRNVIFLMRRIPRGSDEELKQELEILSAFCGPDRPFMVTKEAVGAVALLTVPRAEHVLVDALAAFEFGVLDGTLPYSEEETLDILDRTCAALARLGRQEAVRALVDHGFRKEPQLGNTLTRLRHLGACDLRRNPAQLRAVYDGLRKLLPARLLGLVLRRRLQEVSDLVRALSGTPEPEVQALFEEIVERFPDQDFAEQAADALAGMRSPAGPEEKAPPALNGDLELFQLPTLLQSMADSELTGRLVLTETNGRDHATIHMHKGKIHHCEVGRLRGLDAVCHLFERPQGGTFRFEHASPEQVTSQDGEVLDVLSTILEAMRRQDEFQQDRALVPDGSSLMPGEESPSVPESETDLAFTRSVWREAAKGTAPESCEGVVGDAYRVRRLYTHWLETGALALRPAAA